MARSVISNTHFRGNGQVPRTRSSNAGHYNAPPQFYRRTKTHDSAAISAYGKSGGTLSDFENYIESAIPLPDDRTDQGSEMLIEPVEIKKPIKAKIKTKKPAGKKSAAKKKAAPKKKTAPKKRMAAKTRKPAAKRSTTKKSTVKKAAPKAKVARKTSHPKKQPKTAAKNKKSSAAIFGNPAVHMQAETMVVRTGPCQSFQYGSSEFQLSTITSNSKEISSMPWQEIVRGDRALSLWRIAWPNRILVPAICAPNVNRRFQTAHDKRWQGAD